MSESEASPIGARAIVIGAGIGGLTAAAALHRLYEEVILLERDTLTTTAVARPSVPQGKHLHALLAGGLRAMERLLPGLEQALANAGAVKLRNAVDMRLE